MNPEILKEYFEAREGWIAALKNETVAAVTSKSARYRFNEARAALRSEEQELLTAKVETYDASEANFRLFGVTTQVQRATQQG